MAQLFVDSTSGYRTADINTRWAGGSGSMSISNANVPPGSQAGSFALASTNNPGAFVQSNNYGAQGRLIMAVQHNITASGGGNEGFIGVFGNPNGLGNPILQIAGFAADRAGTYIYGATGTLLGTGPVIPRDEWHHYEFDVTFGNAANATLNLYLDGSPTPLISVTNATLTAATGSIAQVGHPSNVSNGFWTSFYLFSGSGSAPFNAALAPQGYGQAKVAFAVPNGAGIISNWTPNGAGTIWQSINQIPQDGDTTYASDATPGDQYQCTFGALPAMQTLLSVQLSTYARTDDAGPRAYQSGFYTGGVYGYSGVNNFLGATYNYFEDEYMVNPVTSAAWAPGDLTGLQFGAKLTV